MMFIKSCLLSTVLCISLFINECGGKINAKLSRSRRQSEVEKGLCYNGVDCDITKASPVVFAAVSYDECCKDLDGGKSLGLSDGSCSNCPEPTPTTAPPPKLKTEAPTPSEWTPWEVCSRTCGSSGTSSRKGLCKRDRGELHICSVENKPCNRNVSCPVHGQWGKWSSWTECSETCTQSREKLCNNPKPSNGGDDCEGSSSETRKCQRNPPCPTDGEWGEWNTQQCTKSCGGGIRYYTRECDNPPPQHGGNDCVGSKFKWELCNTGCCPVDGRWSEYGSWSRCEVSCGGGRRFRFRKCDTPPPSCNGRNCSGFERDEESCSPNNCPVNGNWSEWFPSPCSSTCGRGIRQLFRKCDNPPPSGGGLNCPGFGVKVELCGAGPCPIDGVWSGWSSWSECPVCGKGNYKNRTKKCDNPPPQHGGLKCPGSFTDRALCYLDACPVDGGWSEWTDFTGCPKSCGGSQYLRTRKCDKPAPKHGGQLCPGDYREFKQCNTHKCPVNGAWSYWTEWTHCSTTCDRGGRNRSRACNNPVPRYNGTECPGPAREWAPCPGPRKCPVDGVWSEWSSFTPCTKSCEGGTKESFRECNNPSPRHDGNFCSGNARKTCECNKQKCPIDGGWTWWSMWSSCSSSCNGGKQNRTRECTNPHPRHGGLCCQGPQEEIQNCGEVKCPVDGNWGSWSAWSDCSKRCDSGRRYRTRSCSNPAPDFGGKPCTDSSTVRQEELCNTHICPVNGGWSAWTQYTFCSKTCATGSQSRTRECNNPVPKFNGSTCGGSKAESRLCNTFGCPVDGAYSVWSSWTSCPKTCGTGSIERKRHCNQPLNGGRSCLSIGPAEETKDCCRRSCTGSEAYSIYYIASVQSKSYYSYYYYCYYYSRRRCSSRGTYYSRTYSTQQRVQYRTVNTEPC